jgi:hypothetical protein
MSLANIQGKLSRTEMKNIMAGSTAYAYKCCIGSECTPCSTTQGQCGPTATLTTCFR